MFVNVIYSALYDSYILILCINVQLLLIISCGQADESTFVMAWIAYKKDYT